MKLADVQLDDKFTQTEGTVFLSGTQALVRVMLDQARRDTAAGLNTAGFVSGYRGSPLGGLDQNLWKARKHLRQHRVVFQPGLNEDLGATAVWGTQQVNLFEGARYDGVFGLWYGKGPGVDRTGDVFKHANAAGTSRFGGVIAIAGDDHGCKSSTLPSQSEYAFMDAEMPVLNPSDVQELLDFGLLGLALSRFSGCWVGLKAIADNADSTATVCVDPQRLIIVEPGEFDAPAGGLHIRWPDPPLQQELRLQRHKLYAALAFARANSLNGTRIDSDNARLGIVTTGKAYLDVMQALDDLGIDTALARDIGLRVYKVGMSWPLEPDGIREFARGLDEILVVEEKRAVIENQLKEQLYNWSATVRPRVVGKFDQHGEWILPSAGELTPACIARVIASRIEQFVTSQPIRERLAFLLRKEAALSKPRELLERVPHYCSGCPHSTSTKVPAGSRALAGIGCHYMATWMPDRNTETFSQMGGEGVAWIGQAPFTDTGHVFVNLGDGTYFHSGVLAIRAAVAAGVNITYKLLYNDAVAMTGGQPVDGHLSVARITRQLAAEGVSRIAVVNDETSRHSARGAFATSTTFHERDEMPGLQTALREHHGVSVLIYDQTCAAKKRRQRKQGKLPLPTVRPFINAAVCEGCGDCSVQSNCLSIVPIDTPFGQKRAIDQPACNVDLTCVKGFCPSFVTVQGATVRRHYRKPDEVWQSPLPEPQPAAVNPPYGILVTGVGGTGVTTVAALLGMAGHLEGKNVSVVDMTGLAQKYGAVTSHVRIADAREEIHAKRIAAGGAHLLLGCDQVVAAGFDALAKCDPDVTRSVINAQESMTPAFLTNPTLEFPAQAMHGSIDEALRARASYVDATRFAEGLVGNPLAAGLLLVGVAYQQGLLPLSAAAICRAIELNGVAVTANQDAFAWGRIYAIDPVVVRRAAGVQAALPASASHDLDALVEQHSAHLEAYQDADYARRYRQRVKRLREIEFARVPGRQSLALAVARGYAKLLAYKDEYEVARLFTDDAFAQSLDAQFQGRAKLRFHFAPPLISPIDANTGRPRKRSFGPWILGVMKLLSRLKRLRGTPWDVFGYARERREERALIERYEDLLDRLEQDLSAANYDVAVELAALPEMIRGFGPVKAQAVTKAAKREQKLLALFVDPLASEAA